MKRACITQKKVGQYWMLPSLGLHEAKIEHVND
jgi:hypothetical protein